MQEKCPVPDCNQLCSGIRWDGIMYCPTHYRELFFSTLAQEYEAWGCDSEPSKRFRSLLGRFCEEFCQLTGDSYLTLARIRDRGFNFQKNSKGCQFSITRHLNAWNDTKAMSRIVEIWAFDFASRVFSLVEKRPWERTDPS